MEEKSGADVRKELMFIEEQQQENHLTKKRIEEAEKELGRLYQIMRQFLGELEDRYRGTELSRSISEEIDDTERIFGLCRIGSEEAEESIRKRHLQLLSEEEEKYEKMKG